MVARFLAPTIEVSAHCDLPCGVYDPAQARIEAQSIKGICEKVAANDDPDFRVRALIIKEQRAELVKHHLWVLWTDYFKPPHFEMFPSCTSWSTRPPSSPAPQVPRALSTWTSPTSYSPKSTR